MSRVVFSLTCERCVVRAVEYSYFGSSQESKMSDWWTDLSRILDTPAIASASSPPSHTGHETPGSTGRLHRDGALAGLSSRRSPDRGQDLSPRWQDEDHRVDPLSGLYGQPTVKLHRECEPDELGLRNYSNRRVSVRGATMKNLKVASEALREVKHMLPPCVRLVVASEFS